MKKILLAVFSCATLLSNAQTLYWDNNDSTPGTGDTPTRTWNVDAFWSADLSGSTATTTWTDGSAAVFAAGTEATNAYTVTISGSTIASGIDFEEGSVTVTGGTLNLSGGSASVAGNLSAKISSVITNGVGLTKSGDGMLELTANNTFSNGVSGAVTVNAGTLSFTGETSATIGSANPLGAYPATATSGYLTLNAGTILRSTKAGSVAGTTPFVLPNRGIAISGGATFEMTNATVDTALLYSGVIAGSGGLTKTGGGSILLGSSNTFSGDVTIKAGSLGVGSSGTFGNNTGTPGTLVFDGGDFLSSGSRTFAAGLNNPILIKTNAAFRAFGGGFTSGTRTNSFKSTNIVATNGTFTLENRGTAGTLFIVQFNKMGSLQFTRPIVLGTGCRFDLWNDDTVTDAIFSGNISGSGSMQYTSSGTGTGGSTIVTGTNTYTGTNSLNGGYLGFRSDTLPASGPIVSGPIGTSTLFVKHDPTVGILAYGGARTVRNPMTFVTVDNFRIIGTNDLTMQGAVTFNSSNLTFTADNTGLSTFSGNISGGTAGKTFTKAGNGTVIFSGTNTYIIPTTISAGTLLVNNSGGSGTGTGPVTINSGTTLGGTGIISGAVTNNGNISPGSSAGTLTLGGGLNLSGGGTYVWELATNSTTAGSFDKIALTGGNLSLGGSSLSINFTNAATTPDSTNSFWQSSHTWTIVSLSGTATNSGASNFGSLQNATFAAGTFTTSTNGNGGIDLTFTASSQAPVFEGTITGAGTANVGLSWSASNGNTYQVQYKDDLNTANWSVLGNVTATGNTASTNDTTGPVAQRFYRLVVQ